MATARRRKKQSGQEIIEFALTAFFLVPLFLGTFVTGMNLIRSIQVNEVTRDIDDMYIHGADFSTYGMQQVAQALTNGLGLNVGTGFASGVTNMQANTSNGGNGLVTVSEIMYIGTTTQATCTSVGASNCVNANSFVFLQQIQFGNGNLANSSTVSVGTLTDTNLTTSGTLPNPATDKHAKLSNQSAMNAIWAGNTNQQALTDGQVVYITEAYFQSPDLTISSLLGSGVYARYFF